MPLTKNILSKYHGTTMVETGTGDGNGVELCLLLKYVEVRSVESDKEKYEHAVNRFKGQPVKLWFGDSKDVLEEMIQDIDSPVIFWLDAHNRSGPILAELEIITRHPIKNHIIIIDDIVDGRKLAYDDVPIQELTKALLKVNPSYYFALEQSSQPFDVLVAYVP